MQVSVACSAAAGSADEVAVRLAKGASVREAIVASGLLERFPVLDISSCTVGIWGRASSLDAALREGDRVELYRPLQMDPMEARRLRASRAPKRR